MPAGGTERETGATGVTMSKDRGEGDSAEIQGGDGGGRGEDAEGVGGRGECNRTE